jgi:hypothetical protein
MVKKMFQNVVTNTNTNGGCLKISMEDNMNLNIGGVNV